MLTMIIKTAIIADDFTGAGDSSIHFCHAGYSVYLPLSLTNAVLPDGLEILAVNTESRLDEGAAAYKKTAQAVTMCRSWGTESFYKKIDSTMRGNIHDEIQAVLDCGHYTAVIICPAAPEIGRTVENGQCLLHSTPIDQTETGQDYLNPVKSSYIKDFFAVLPATQIAHISVGDVERGPSHLKELVENITATGASHIICDASTSDHLAAIATLKANPQLLLAGAAGLAAAIARQPPLIVHPKHTVDFSAGNILVSSGSRMEISRTQLARLAEEYDCAPILIPTQALATNDESAFDQFWNELRTLKPGSKNSCYILTPDSHIGVDCQDGSRGNSEKIAAFLAEATASLCDILNVSVLISIGGHTTYQTVKKLNAAGVTYEGEILPGTPFGQLLSAKPSRTLTLITKSGSFGNSEALVDIFNFVKTNMKHTECT